MGHCPGVGEGASLGSFSLSLCLHPPQTHSPRNHVHCPLTLLLGSASATFPSLFPPVPQLPSGHHPLSPCQGRNVTQVAPGSLLGCSCGQRVSWTAGHPRLLCVCACATYEGRCTHVKMSRSWRSPSCPGPASCLSLAPPPLASLGTSLVALQPAPAMLPPILLLRKLSNIQKS